MSEIEIRRLTVGDLGFADEVREIAGWNQLLADWKCYLALEPEGCFLAEADGAPAGTATTTCYGTDLAWIGMVLVHPEFRRRGIGTALLEHAIRYLRDERGIRCVKLDATPEGRPLYEKLGFQAERGLRRWLRRRSAGEASECWERQELGERAFTLDREVFGADRGELLRWLERDGLSVCARPDGSFGLMRDGNQAIYVGPISASDDKTGREIVKELMAQSPPDRSVFWDFPDANLAAAELAVSLGFEPVRDLTRMWLGEENASQGDPKRTFGIADFGLG